jgi:very-short-patch-repair endonuclease
LKFEHQKRFDGLIGTGGKRLSYDFYVEDYNLLIEYQGEQHDHPVVFSNTTLDDAHKNFETQCEHDKRKREYARDNGFGLLEIWYYDFDNVESILSNYIINNTKLF